MDRTETPRKIGAKLAQALPLALIAISTAFLLWGAPRCTGPTQADRCPLAGTANTSVHTYRGER